MRRLFLSLLLVIPLAAAGFLSGCDEQKDSAGMMAVLLGLLGAEKNRAIEVAVIAQAGPSGGMFDMGDVADTQSSERSFTVTNRSADVVTISSVEKISGDTDQFAIFTVGMAASLPASGATSFSILFEPASIGDRDVTIRINYSPGDKRYTFRVRGTALGCYDQDGDGYGEGSACRGRDCNDFDPAIHPGAAEVCGNDVDDDCDDIVDEGC